MFFPVVMYGCESWTIKKAEHQRSDAFELWCCRRVLRVPWTARKCNQSILKEISPEYSLAGLSSLQMVTAVKLEDTVPWKKSSDQPRQHIKKQRHYFAKKILSSQKYVFFQQSHVDFRIGLQRKLSTKEVMLLNCGVEDSS